MEWQPIETAPKEPGARILVCVEDGDVVIGKCHRFNDGSIEYMDGDDYTCATYWKPLPESKSKD